MSAQWAWRRLITGLFAVLITPVLATVLTLPGAQGDNSPVPTVSINAPASPLIGESVAFDVDFWNASTGTGYGPYVDLRLPLGADLNDGLTFTSATYLGATVTSTVLTANAGGCVTHPYALQASGAPVQICGLAVNQSYVVLRLPFGSFTPGQPAATVHVTTQLSNYADAGTALTIGTSGGFQFGATPLNDYATDPSIQGALVTTTVTPTIMRVTKSYAGPEDETATGPNYPRSYTISVTVAPGQTVTSLVVTDTLPNTIQYLSTNATTPASSAVSTPLLTTPGGTLSRNFPSITGTGGTDATMTFNFYVPRLDAGSNPVLAAATGAFNTSTDNASASGTWTPADIRDSTGPVSAGPATHTLTDKSLAVQKSVGLAIDTGPAGVSPGDTLAWTISVQVSDYFALNTVVVDDLLGDGTRFDGTFTPTMAVAGNGYNLSAAGMNVANFTNSGPNGQGKTPLSFRVSSELTTRGQGAHGGAMLGGCVDPAGYPTPDCTNHNDGATTATIVFRSIVQQTYVNGTTQVVEGDTLTNQAAATAKVLNAATFVTTGNTIGDGSAGVATAGTSASISIARGSLQKTIYAVNGSTSFATPLHVSPGDSVTYRLQQSFPTSRTDDFRITDFLPLPVFPATSTIFDPVANAAAPAAGHAKYGPADTFHLNAGAPTPAPTTNGGANSVEFAYGDYALYPPAASTADILFTVTVSTNPFADGLLLTNQARSQTKNAIGTVQTADAIVQIILDQPVLTITKGVVGTNNAAGVFAPVTTGPVTFSATVAPPAGVCPGFTGGPVTTAGLAAHPIDSDLSGVDAGDYVRFEVAVQNTGHAGVFGVQVKDTIPAGFVVPTNGSDMCATDGAGTTLATTNIGSGGTGLFDLGIQLNDGTLGSLAAGVSGGVTNTAGTNIALISYTLQVAPTAVASDPLLNTASLLDFINAPGATGHLSSPLTDTATVTLADPSVVKTLLGSSEPSTGGNNVTIGEVVTYQVTVTVPEGTMPAAKLKDTLPVGLAYVSCTSIVTSNAVDVTTSLGADFSTACSSATQVGQDVTFSLGNVTNANTDNGTAETITLTYKVVVQNVAGNHRLTAALVNSAALSWTGHALAAVQGPSLNIVEPALTISKSPLPATGDAGDTIAFTITITADNNANASHAFDVDLTDAIPAGMTYVAASIGCTGTGCSTDDTTPANLKAHWSDIPKNTVVTVTYSATLDASVVSGDTYTNTANVKWTSLPGVDANERSGTGTLAYTQTTTAGVLVTAATAAKIYTLDSESSTVLPNVTIGEVVTYEVTLTIPEGTMPVAKVKDTLPVGLAYVSCTSIVTSNAVDVTTSLGADFSTACSSATQVGQDVTFSLGNVTNANTDNGTAETITLTYKVVVQNVGTNIRAHPLQNAAVLSWTGHTLGAVKANSLNVYEPKLTIGKARLPISGDAGDTIAFTITITADNNANASHAFDVDLTDAIPAGMTYVAASIGCTGTGCSTDDTTPANLKAHWSDIPKNTVVTVTYSATLDASVVSGDTYTNTANVKWTSLPGVDANERSGTGTLAYTQTTTAGVLVTAATAAKIYTLDSESSTVLPNVTIGEVVTYEVTLTIPEGTMPVAKVKDTLPVGLAYVSCTSIVTSNAVDVTTSLGADFSTACSGATQVGQDVTFNLGNVTNANRDNGTGETITLTYKVVVQNVGTNIRAHPLQNGAVLSWTGHTLGAVKANSLNVYEPALTISKSPLPATGDAGDTIAFTVTITADNNANASHAFDVDLTDAIPAGMTYVAASIGCTGTGCSTDDTTPANLEAHWADIPKNTVVTVTYSATLDANVPSGSTYVNTANVKWTSLPGVDANERSGTGTLAYTQTTTATVTVTQPAPAKTIVTTSEAGTSGTDVAIGEIVRFRVAVSIPEGVTPAVSILDSMPAGMRFLNDNTALVTLVATVDGNLSSSTLIGAGVSAAGNDSWSGHPTFVLPGGSISGGTGAAGAFIDGDDPVFALGDLSNIDSDPDYEVAVIEFNALVDNVAGNAYGVTLGDTATISKGGTPLATSTPALTVTVAEPNVTFAKTIQTTPHDGGDTVVYQIAVRNITDVTHSHVSPAYDLQVTDSIDANLVVQSIVVAGPGTWHNNSSAPGRSVDVTFDALPANAASNTITITATVADAADVGKQIPNTANSVWTSLPGANGTTVNATGSANTGTAGAATGERDNDGGAMNNYRATSSAPLTLDVPAISKYGPAPATVPIGGTSVFDIVVTLPEGTTEGLAVVDTLPAGLMPVSYSVVKTAAASGGRLTSDFSGTLATPTETTRPAGSAGGAWTMTFGPTVVPVTGSTTDGSFLVQVTTQVGNVIGNQSGGHLINAAGVKYTDPQLGTTTIAAIQAPYVAILEPVVNLTKNANPTTPSFGSVVTYTLSLSHDVTSNATAHDMVVTDTLPAGLTYVGGSLSKTGGLAATSSSVVGNVITINFDTFLKTDTSTFTYQATVAAAGTVNLKDTLTNNARATWTSLAGVDANERTGANGVGAGLNNYAAATTAPVVVSGIDLTISNNDGQAQATAGVTRTYALGYQNVGNGTATNSTITETVPVGTTFKSAGSTAGWDCADAAAAGTVCHHLAGSGTLVANASGSVNFAVTVVDPIAAAQNTIVDTASIADDHATNVDPTPANNVASDTDTIPMADLSLTKTVDAAHPGKDQIITFTLTLTNGGGAQATNVNVVDVIPAALSYQGSTPSQGTYDSGSGLWTVGTVNSSASATLLIQAKVTATTSVVNSAEVTHSDQGDIDSTPGNGVQSEDDWASAAVNPTVSDIGVTKTIDNSHPNVGSDVTFTITATNYGPDDATGVRVTDNLPAGLTFVSATPSGGWSAGTWTVGSMVHGTSQSLLLVAHVANPGAITNTATVTSDDFDTNPANNTASASLDQLVDITVDKTVDNATPNVGTTVLFTVTIGNLGPGDAHNVVIHDALPAGLTLVSFVPAQGSYDAGAGNWSVGTLGLNASVTATVKATVAGSNPMTNTASVLSLTEPQASTLNDSKSVTITPPQADLVLTKIVANARPDLHEADTFTITVTNAGPDTATNVVASDLLPAGLSLDPANPPEVSQGSFDAATGKWTVGSLAMNADATLWLHVLVDLPNDYTNTATVAADQFDPNTANNTASALLTTRVADMAVTKVADKPAPTVGTTVTYTVTATNNGPDDATQLVIHDALPAGLTYISSNPSAGTYDANTGDWTIGALAFTHTVTLDVSARVVGSGSIANTAAVSGLLQRDLVPANDSATATIDVPPAADLALTKTVDVAAPDKGSNVTFTITITNHGPNATSGVHVLDPLPDGLTRVSDTETVGSCDPVTGDWTVGSMAVGAVETMTVTATVTSEGPVTNSAEVSASSLPDPNSTPGNGVAGENDQAAAVINSHGVADLALTKVVSNATPHKGDHTTYTLVVTDNGPDEATGVIVRDQLPSAVTFVSSSDGNYNPVTGAWTVGTLASGGSATITITVLVGQTGTIVNTADVVASDQRDPVEANGEATAGVSAAGATPPVTITHDPGQAPGSPGSLALWVMGLAIAGFVLIGFGSLGARSRRLRRRM